MKSPHFFLCVLLAISGCSSSHVDESDSVASNCGGPTAVIISGDSVGQLTIGAIPDSIHALCEVVSDTIELGPEAVAVRMLRIPMADDTVIVEVHEGRAWRISIDGASIRTRDGLGVGSTLDELVRTGIDSTILGEGRAFVLLADRCGLSFELDHVLTEQDLMRPWTLEALMGLSPATRVSGVLVFGC